MIIDTSALVAILENEPERRAFVDNLLAGKTTVPATQWPNSEWTNTSLTPDAYDPEGAKALLEEAGYTADKRHNALFGGSQGYFVDVPHRRPVDVLVDKLEVIKAGQALKV